MKKKIFAVSDIHGNFPALIEALKDAGFDENNDSHLLVVLGDHFDRGEYSVSVYEYLKKLTDKGKAITIMGNHDLMFIDYLEGTVLDPFNYFRNGERETFADFWHRTAPFESWLDQSRLVVVGCDDGISLAITDGDELVVELVRPDGVAVQLRLEVHTESVGAVLLGGDDVGLLAVRDRSRDRAERLAVQDEVHRLLNCTDRSVREGDRPGIRSRSVEGRAERQRDDRDREGEDLPVAVNVQDLDRDCIVTCGQVLGYIHAHVTLGDVPGGSQSTGDVDLHRAVARRLFVLRRGPREAERTRGAACQRDGVPSIAARGIGGRDDRVVPRRSTAATTAASGERAERTDDDLTIRQEVQKGLGRQLRVVELGVDYVPEVDQCRFQLCDAAIHAFGDGQGVPGACVRLDGIVLRGLRLRVGSCCEPVGVVCSGTRSGCRIGSRFRSRFCTVSVSLCLVSSHSSCFCVHECLAGLCDRLFGIAVALFQRLIDGRQLRVDVVQKAELLDDAGSEAEPHTSRVDGYRELSRIKFRRVEVCFQTSPHLNTFNRCHRFPPLSF